MSKRFVGERRILVSGSLKIVDVKCSECGTEKRMSLKIDEDFRFTWCSKDGKATIWKQQH